MQVRFFVLFISMISISSIMLFLFFLILLARTYMIFSAPYIFVGVITGVILLYFACRGLWKCQDGITKKQE